jgi:hypothetical protein
MAINVVLTHGKNNNFIIDLYLLIFLVSNWEKYFSVAKNTLQLFFSLSTNQYVVENIVTKGGFSTSGTILHHNLVMFFLCSCLHMLIY